MKDRRTNERRLGGRVRKFLERRGSKTDRRQEVRRSGKERRL